jgi:predicted tellurium resistance membrane protein TerC
MNENTRNSQKGFRYGIISLSLLLSIAIIMEIMKPLVSDLWMLLGLVEIGCGILALIGLPKCIKGLNEPKTKIRNVGIIANGCVVLFFIILMISHSFELF